MYVYVPPMNKKEAVLVDSKKVQKIWGVEPKQMVDLQTLIGDSIDSIPHVLTENKARKLLAQHGSLKKYFATKEGLQFWNENQAELVRNRSLVRLAKDCVNDLPLKAPDLFIQQRDGKGVERATGVRLPESFHALQSYCHTKQVNLFAK